MGSQRAQDTVRGVVTAIWLDGDPSKGKRIWTHPERGGVDLDLSVITTNAVPGTPDRRSIDFHELYWAHLMSETRAVAVLLWLFELARKGPRLKPGMGALWWAGAIFLSFLISSVVLLGLHAIERFAKVAHEPQSLLLAPFFVVFMIASYSVLFSALRGALRLAVSVAPLAAIAGVVFYYGINSDAARHATEIFLPLSVAFFGVAIVMGGWGVLALGISYPLSLVFFWFYWSARFLDYQTIWKNGWILWSLTEDWSAVIACFFVVMYLVLNAMFLQPYLGDAARYFRNSPANVKVRREIRKEAVDTLAALHDSGLYDRIVVVAHSLGSVVAYDMLRAYFSQVCDDFPDPATLGADFKRIDRAKVDPDKASPEKIKKDLRMRARHVVARIAAAAPPPTPRPDPWRKPKTWLVTDFVTLGSPLTHAQYLICRGKTHRQLEEDFRRRVSEREFLTCPPKRLDHDGLLSFKNPRTSKYQFHHAALFGLTRWTNLYFPLSQLFWGDAIGGPLAPVFGSHIRDIKVSTHKPAKDAFFTHTAYWDIARKGGRNAPHIAALREAVDLVDVDKT
jgi:hypothetical protein